jgi:hypothetical protein
MSTRETNPAPEAPNSRSPKPRAKQSVPISVFLGIMVVPLAAAASMFLVSPQIEEPVAVAADVATAELTVASFSDLAQDLIVACGPVATEMIELGKAGGLTTLQAAALDALRPICSQEGLPLPEGPGSQTVQAVLTRSTPVANGAATAASDDDDWDDSLDSDDSSDDWDD